jgi:hypothetical protein
MGPKDVDLGVQRKQPLDRDLVYMGVKEELLLCRQLGQALDYRLIGVRRREVKLADALVAPRASLSSTYACTAGSLCQPPISPRVRYGLRKGMMRFGSA